jgi:hypothetical protein
LYHYTEAEAEAEMNEEEIDLLMLVSMAEFPGYEPVTASEREYGEGFSI